MHLHRKFFEAGLRRRGVASLLVLFLATACADVAPSGVTDTADDPALGPALGAGACVLASVSGNGLASNGLTGNGLCQNGLAAGALTRTGLGTTTFATWFNTNVGLNDVLMRYLTKCAAPAGSTLAWTNPTTRVTHGWAGGLGLAPGWTGGKPATVAEQQVVSACLGALVNKYGVSVTIAVEGRTAAGVQLAVGSTELATYSVREACFFGNLFSGQGLFVGLDHASWDSKTSSVRACGLDHQTVGPSLDCPPLYYVDYCAKSCTLDATKTFYESCTWGGVTYKPLTTRLKPADVYKCGDGVCQFTERCGSGADWDNCKPDCGLCP